MVNGEGIKQYKFCKKTDDTSVAESVCFSYKNFEYEDFEAMFTPASQTQAPILKESLKMCGFEQENNNKNLDIVTIKKCSQKESSTGNDTDKTICSNCTKKNDNNINCDNYVVTSEGVSFIPYKTRLACLVAKSAILTNKNGSTGTFTKSYNDCISMITRIDSILTNEYYKKIFNFENDDKTECITEELKNKDNLIKIFSLKDVPFSHNMRPVLMNCIGRWFLNQARKGAYKENPTIIFLDEAHQFLNYKTKGADDSYAKLDAFDNIARECRKHGLYICLATQMPRDIPSGTLSQVGNFIVHRLINEEDKDKIKNTCQESTRDVISYLPMLKAGECVLINNKIPMPVRVQIDPIKDGKFEPKSTSPLEEHFGGESFSINQ